MCSERRLLLLVGLVELIAAVSLRHLHICKVAAKDEGVGASARRRIAARHRERGLSPRSIGHRQPSGFSSKPRAIGLLDAARGRLPSQLVAADGCVQQFGVLRVIVVSRRASRIHTHAIIAREARQNLLSQWIVAQIAERELVGAVVLVEQLQSQPLLPCGFVHALGDLVVRLDEHILARQRAALHRHVGVLPSSRGDKAQLAIGQHRAACRLVRLVVLRALVLLAALTHCRKNNSHRSYSYMSRFSPFQENQGAAFAS